LRKVVNFIDVSQPKADDLNDKFVFISMIDNSDIMLRVSTETGRVIETSGNTEARLKGKSLSAIVGKALAKKILTATEEMKIEGEGLEIGGEGMEAFYDRQLPGFLNKYMRGKGWNSKVGKSSITTKAKDPISRGSWAYYIVKSSTGFISGYGDSKTEMDKRLLDVNSTSTGPDDIYVIMSAQKAQ